MRFRTALLLVLPALATGCDTLSTYYRPGVTVTRMQQDEAYCTSRAHRLAPVHTVIRERPDVWVPPRRICERSGSAPTGAVIGTLIERECRTEPGYWREGASYTYDVNENRRRGLETDCMSARGYARVTLPHCGSETPVRAPGRRMPRELTEQSCAVMRDGTLWQIVTPQG